MAKKVENPEMTEAVESADVYFKTSILKSKRFSNRKDALSILLKDDEPYTLEQVEEILDNFMKGRVN